MQYGICVGFNFDGTFFDKKCELSYEDRRIEIVAGDPKESHRVKATYENGGDTKKVFQTISRFLSELSWKLRIEIDVILCVHGTGTPDCCSPNLFKRSDKYFIHDFKQEIFQRDQHLALGFYREGFSSNSPFYKFLSFYKILEIPFNDGNDKGRWIESLIPKIIHSKFCLDYLQRNGIKDIAKWIFEEGRNGLAHAYRKRQGSILDITAYDHWQNIVWANEVVQELAEITMIEKLFIPKR